MGEAGDRGLQKLGVVTLLVPEIDCVSSARSVCTPPHLVAQPTPGQIRQGTLMPVPYVYTGETLPPYTPPLDDVLGLADCVGAPCSMALQATKHPSPRSEKDSLIGGSILGWWWWWW